MMLNVVYHSSLLIKPPLITSLILINQIFRIASRLKHIFLFGQTEAKESHDPILCKVNTAVSMAEMEQLKSLEVYQG